jgi:hypothetical protein
MGAMAEGLLDLGDLVIGDDKFAERDEWADGLGRGPGWRQGGSIDPKALRSGQWPTAVGRGTSLEIASASVFDIALMS